MTLPAITMEELIKHRLPNVLIRRAGSRAWVEIRGQGSITAGTEALIIIDGVRMEGGVWNARSRRPPRPA